VTRLLNNCSVGKETPTPVPMYFARERGTIIIPSKLDATVIARASAELPPTSCVSVTPLDSVVGMQQNIANPVINSRGEN